MSWGDTLYGIGSWGDPDFTVINQVPADGYVNASRTPTISFTLSSTSNAILVNYINVAVNGIEMITNGLFTDAASGTIDSSDTNAINVSIDILQAFAPLTLVLVVVSALNVANQTPTSGTMWSFTVDAISNTFTTYIVRGFQRVFNGG